MNIWCSVLNMGPVTFQWKPVVRYQRGYRPAVAAQALCTAAIFSLIPITPVRAYFAVFWSSYFAVLPEALAMIFSFKTNSKTD
jgi:hypothetical protein